MSKPAPEFEQIEHDREEIPVTEFPPEVGYVDTVEIQPVETLEEFKRKVEALCTMMKADPDVRDRIIAETYINIANMETAIRGTFQMLQTEGVSGMLKGMFSRKKGKNDGAEPRDSD